MECKDILNLIAIIVIPIVAVLIGQHLQNRAEIRKDKMHIFKVLMTSRIYGWTQESVHCLNIIDIVFSDDENVRNAWKDLYDIRELVELENGVNFTGNAEIAIVLTEKELDNFISQLKNNTKCQKLYLGHDILMDAQQAQALKDRKITVNIIPDYYYKELEG